MIDTCGYENCEPGHSYGPLLRNGCLIHYVLSGQGAYQARGRGLLMDSILYEYLFLLADKFPNKKPAAAEYGTGRRASRSVREPRRYLRKHPNP